MNQQSTHQVEPDPVRAQGALGSWQAAGLTLLAASILAWSWWRVQGYEIADAVEYLERAWAFSRGEAMIDNKSIRAVGFSALLLPLFLIAPLISDGDLTWIPWAARVLQIGLTCALVLVVARMASRLSKRHASRSAALGAGVLLATNPAILRWGVCPVSGVASSLCLALALDQLLFPAAKHALQRSDWRRGWLSGLALGASLCLAYSVLPLVAAVLAASLWIGFKRRKLLQGLWLAFAGMVLLQCVADQLYYGRFGLSLVQYLHENFGSNAALILFQTGRALGVETLVEAGRKLYDAAAHATPVDHEYQQQVLAGAEAIRMQKSRLWYLENAPAGLTFGGIALILLGSAAALRARSKTSAWLLVVCAVCIGATSLKGSKDFRLWLPILGLLAAMGGLGFGTLARRQGVKGAGVARAAAWLALLAAAIQGPLELARTQSTSFAAYWRAMDWLNDHAHTLRERHAHAAPAQAFQPPTVASAFHWAVFLREKPWLTLQKLPRHLGYWDQYSAEEKALDLAALEGLDFFISHTPELTSHPEVLASVARLFEVRAAFFDRERERAGLGPVLVFSRRSGTPGERVLFEFTPGLAPAAAPRLEFRSSQPGFLRLVDFRYEALPGDGWGWIRYRWHGGGFGEKNWTFIDRLTAARGTFAWQNNHAPAYGQCPTSAWGEGATLEEGYLVVPEQDPFRIGPRNEPRRFLGGEFLAGDLVPSQLWLQIADFQAQDPSARVLEPVHPQTRVPLREALVPEGPQNDEGHSLSGDGYARAGSLWLQVAPAARKQAVTPQ